MFSLKQIILDFSLFVDYDRFFNPVIDNVPQMERGVQAIYIYRDGPIPDFSRYVDTSLCQYRQYADIFDTDTGIGPSLVQAPIKATSGQKFHKVISTMLINSISVN